MFQVTVNGVDEGIVYTTSEQPTARKAIAEAARNANPREGQRVRLGVHEAGEEIFWAWGDTLEAAALDARQMDGKSRRCGGR